MNANATLAPSLRHNLDMLKNALGHSTDFIVRSFRIGDAPAFVSAALLYTEGLADSKIIDEFIMEPLMSGICRSADFGARLANHRDPLALLKDSVLTVNGLSVVPDAGVLLEAILSGDTAILIDGSDRALIAATKGVEHRSIAEPASQTVIRGPLEGFVESIRVNTALIRRKIKDPRLWLETIQIGTVTRTDVGIMYINGIADDSIVREVRQRIERIDIDGILESGYIEELIQDEKWSPFPTIFNSERPDAITAGLLEGRVAILVDGTPFVLLVPALFVQYFQSPEDYYHRWDVSSLIRMIRYMGFLIALVGPSVYIAVTTFHQEMIPTNLLINLASQREGVPFPAFIEALLMEVTFEILREAGIRMPRAVGSAISIVGTLVIGQAAVEAGIVSAAMVIVVSITAISSFVMPSYNMSISIRILRFPLMGLAASFGLFGIFIGLILLVLHLCSLKSFGAPYMTSIAPFYASNQKDTLFRLPRWGIAKRPRLLNRNNPTRGRNPPQT
ncbi:spore germination protein [Cohnella sp. GbtcB17]|uniref:spore germination protein n=1 Tax=Cohnella sp. GbtcB17 TaxID=2824762 RepID=UPI001C3012BF|nr:spore germination protein [Cohnella sp. GbtcB17]